MEAGSLERTRGLTRGFCELTLEARDPTALAAFYSDVFGWEELSSGPDRVWRVKDQTVVEAQQPGRYLQLQAKTRPFGKDRVKLDLAHADGATRRARSL
jgi:hypothetical protein